MNNRLLPEANKHPKKEKASGVLSSFRFYENDFVLDTTTGLFFRVSPTAIFIFQKIAAGANGRDLLAAMQERYQIDRNAAVRDIELLTNELVALGILDRSSIKP